MGNVDGMGWDGMVVACRLVGFVVVRDLKCWCLRMIGRNWDGFGDVDVADLLIEVCGDMRVYVEGWFGIDLGGCGW